jgi:hypothetical protein
MSPESRDRVDIGGGHGYFSVVICRRHRQMQATILDLPEAIKYAAPLLAQEDMGERVVHRAGNALTEDLGVAACDLVFLAAVVHHFDDGTNRQLMQRIGCSGSVSLVRAARFRGAGRRWSGPGWSPTQPKKPPRVGPEPRQPRLLLFGDLK